MNIIQQTNNTIRESELRTTYELFESEYMQGFSLKHAFTKEEIKLTFDTKAAAALHAERNGWTLL